MSQKDPKFDLRTTRGISDESEREGRVLYFVGSKSVESGSESPEQKKEREGGYRLGCSGRRREKCYGS